MPASPDLVRLLEGPVHEVAPRLLGSVLSHGGVSLRLTEVEAYDGAHDPGSHAYRGPTGRNGVMFGPAGHLYVYFTYGMHHCANIVCGPEGRAAAVLLRAGEVLTGTEVARARRSGATDRDLARGPARLCQALAIDLGLGGTALGTAGLHLELATTPDPATVSTGPRVGLRGAPDRPWRYWLTGESTVSTYRPAAPRRGTAR